MSLSDTTLARFAREVAKYPAEQKQSAVMACLAIVQHEQGYVSRESRGGAWPPTSACRRSRCTRSRPSTTCTTSSRSGSSSSTSAPTCRARCATATRRSGTCASKLGVEPYGTTADGLFTVQPSECLGACADAPVMLVNDRQMVSFMSDERLDELVDTLKAQAK